MKPWRLTTQAEISLTEIATWTIKHFGTTQAIKYRDELIECINNLASDNPPASKDCDLLISNNESCHLRYYKQSSHFIVFRQTKRQLEILEFFHQRMDLPTHIENLTQGTPD